MKQTILYNNVEQALEYTAEVLNTALDHTTWVIPQSGGKDSRTTAQVTLALIEKGMIKGPNQIVYYMADTLGEFPSFIDQAKRGIVDLAKKTEELGMETHYFVTSPNPQSDFWVKVIGYGLAPPTRGTRWCTDLMKVAPTRKVLRMNGWNKKPQLIGVRYGESSIRDESLKKSDEERILTCTATGECGPDYLYQRMGKTIPKFAPIKQWKACAVWDWLTIYAHQYGFDNQELIDHYNMNSWLHEREEAHEKGIDEAQGLRYGCWFCPLVYNDKTAAHLAKSNQMVAEMMQFADEYVRRGGLMWKKKNREMMHRLDGTSTDGLMHPDFSEEVLQWFEDFEKRWNYPLLNNWQKSMIRGALEWRREGGTIQMSEIDWHTGNPSDDFGITITPASKKGQQQLGSWIVDQV